MQEIIEALEETAPVGGRHQLGDRVTASQYDINLHAKRILDFLDALDRYEFDVQQITIALREYL